jgi:hypothetical protein
MLRKRQSSDVVSGHPCGGRMHFCGQPAAH